MTEAVDSLNCSPSSNFNRYRVELTWTKISIQKVVFIECLDDRTSLRRGSIDFAGIMSEV